MIVCVYKLTLLSHDFVGFLFHSCSNLGVYYIPYVNIMCITCCARYYYFGYYLLDFFAEKALATKNALGESPVWSVKEQSLYWVS